MKGKTWFEKTSTGVFSEMVDTREEKMKMMKLTFVFFIIISSKSR